MRVIINQKYECLLTITFVLMIFGFYPVGALSELVGYTGSGFTIAYRFFVLCAALLGIALLNLERLNRTEKYTLSLFVAFSFIYFTRISYDVINDPDNLAFPVSQYFIFFICVCIIPAFSSLFFVRYLKFDFFVYTFFVLAVILFLSSLLNFSVYSIAQNITGGRMYSEKVNPIALGHFASSLIITVFVALNYKDCLIKKHWLYVFLCTSIFMMIAAGSRGAVVSTLATLSFYYLLSGKAKIKNILFILFGLVISVYLTYFIISEIYPDRNLLNGFQNMGSDEDMAAGIRFGSFKGAFNQFMDNPIFGDFLEERSTGYYPHNIILEVLMSTGVVGGVFFGLFILNVIVKSIYVFRYSGLALLLSLLFIKTFIGAQFSGGIFASGELLTLSLALVFIKCHFESDR